MLQVTGLTPHGYALTVTLFSVAYALFEVPSNWVMKHWVRPSVWLGGLLAAWGVLTIGYVFFFRIYEIHIWDYSGRFWGS